MKYQQPTFTLPTASSKVTQEEWERIFGKSKPKKNRKLTDEEIRLLQEADNNGPGR